MKQRIALTFAVMLGYALASAPAPAQLARQWVSRTGGTDNSGSIAAVAVVDDDSSFVYASGWMDNKSTGLDYPTVKYDADGVRLWILKRIAITQQLLIRFAQVCILALVLPP